MGVSTNGFFHDSFNIWLESRFFHQYPLKHFVFLRSKRYLKKLDLSWQVMQMNTKCKISDVWIYHELLKYE